MNDAFESFFQNYIIIDHNINTKSKLVGECYTKFNNSSNGKNKLFNYLTTVKGIQKNKLNEFVNIRIRDNNIQNKEIESNEKDKKEIQIQIESNEKYQNEIDIDEEKQLRLELLRIQIKNEKEKNQIEKEKIEEDRKKFETNLKIEKEKIEEDRKKFETNLKIEKEKIETNLKIEKEKIETNLKIENKKIDSNLEIENKKIALEWSKLENTKKMHKERIQHEKEENNKNRNLIMKRDFRNEYDERLKLGIYGTPAQQYITQDSAMRFLLNGIVNPNDIDFNTINNVMTISDKYIVEREIYENQTTKKINAIDINDCKNIIDEIKSNINNDKLNESLDEILDYTDMIQHKVKHDDNERMVKTIVDHIYDKQNKDAKSLSKKDYIRNYNNPRYENTKLYISCSVCEMKIELESNACHKSHDKQRSLNGSYDKENIYLCCANCNLGMSNKYTIREYKLKLCKDKLTELSKDTIDIVNSDKSNYNDKENKLELDFKSILNFLKKIYVDFNI